MKNNIDVLNEAIEEAEHHKKELSLNITFLKKEITKVEDEFIGIREKIRNLREDLRMAKLEVVREFVTLREVEIARMKGFVLENDEILTQEIKDKLNS